jgi:hypothetical protein
MRPEERDPGLDRLYREAERSAPPAHLDAAILAAARREVGARPRSLSESVRRWRVPVSIAALVLLSVSLVTLVQLERGDETLSIAPSPPAAPKPPAAAAPAAPGPDSGAGTAAAPAPAAKPALQPLPAPPRVAEQEAPPPQAAPAGEARAIRPAAAPPRREDRSAVAGAPPAEEASAKALAGSLALQSGGRDRAPAWQGYEKEPPQKWLDRIAELRRQGETAQADEMAAEFKRRFPDHLLPADLDQR